MNPITMKLVVDDLILQALREDITFEDVSTASVCPTARPATVELIAKADGIIAGLDVFARTFELLDSQSSVLFDVVDGDEVHAGDHVGQVRGDARVLLSGERVALNYLQRMSGIATYTHNMAAALEGTKTVLVDTRKTTPGMRVFEKAAVEIGGGSNHRYNLSTAVMLKDNHIDAAGGVTRAIEMARAHASFTATVEIECENLDMVREAVEAGADIIMFDNMTHDDMAAAIELIAGGSALAHEVGVSRQVVVQDIALLRADGHDIVATNRGYVLQEAASSPAVPTRLVKVRHSVEQAGDELTSIVDAGGAVLNVIVNHRVYGKITADLDIRNRRDVERYLRDIESGKSFPLLTVTSGYHFHRIAAEDEQTLDEIEAMPFLCTVYF